ncbi:MAG: hypothetical protein ACP5NI_10670, partial [Acetobacteraceae bacterium]
MTEPCDLSAREARARIGARLLSPVELVESCIRRVEAVDHAVNALIARDFARARAQARAAEAAVLRGEPLGPLHRDRLGSLFAEVAGDPAGPKVMLAGHLDEIGFLITQITEKGFLRFQ